MRETLLTINVVYFLFGATIYCGVMWSLRFFFYPSWSKMTVDNVQDHFIIPTSAATRFFLVVVPIMFFSGHRHGDHRMGRRPDVRRRR